MQPEVDRMTDYLESVVRCRPEKLPIEALAHVFAQKSAILNLAFNCYTGTGLTDRLESCYKLVEEGLYL